MKGLKILRGIYYSDIDSSDESGEGQKMRKSRNLSTVNKFNAPDAIFENWQLETVIKYITNLNRRSIEPHDYLERRICESISSIDSGCDQWTIHESSYIVGQFIDNIFDIDGALTNIEIINSVRKSQQAYNMLL